MYADELRKEPMVIDRCPPAKHLFIAIPSYKFELSAASQISLSRAIAGFDHYGISWTLQIEALNAYIDDARNILVAKFLDSSATDMMFMDDDIGARVEDFMKLALSTYPMVGGNYRKKTHQMVWAAGIVKPEEEYSLREDGMVEVPTAADGTIEVDYLPTGFLRINRQVFEDMPVETYINTEDKETPEYFIAGRQFHAGARRHFTEDIYFCRKWRELGGKIRLIPDMTFDHIGLHSYSGNWAEWQEKQTEERLRGT